MATENLLADILHEIRDVTAVSRQPQQCPKSRTSAESLRRFECELEVLQELNMEGAERSLLMLEDERDTLAHESQIRKAGPSEFDDRDIGGEQSNYAVLNINSRYLY